MLRPSAFGLQSESVEVPAERPGLYEALEQWRACPGGQRVAICVTSRAGGCA